MTAKEPSTMRSLERAFDVLTVLEQNIIPLRLTDIAVKADLANSTTQRILNVLEARGLVERYGNYYQIGVATVPMAHAFLRGNRLSTATLPVLQELADATGLTSSLYVRSGTSRVVVARVEGDHPLRYALPIGERLPLHLGAGRVLATAMSDDELDEMLDSLGTVKMESGITMAKAEFKDSLDEIRTAGYLVARNERVAGVVSVSAPVLSADRSIIGVVLVSGPTSEMTDGKLPQVVTEVRQAAHSIGRRSQAG